jgi:hypothetical protein
MRLPTNSYMISLVRYIYLCASGRGSYHKNGHANCGVPYPDIDRHRHVATVTSDEKVQGKATTETSENILTLCTQPSAVHSDYSLYQFPLKIL